MTQPFPPPSDPPPRPTWGVPPPPPVSYAGPGVSGTDRTARLWATFAHLSGLVGFAVPFGHVIGPLVIWLVKRDQIPFVDEQGKEAVNFQLTATIALVVAAATFCVGIGIVLLPAIALAAAVMTIAAAVRANGGEHYRYPISIRFVR